MSPLGTKHGSIFVSSKYVPICPKNLWIHYYLCRNAKIYNCWKLIWASHLIHHCLGPHCKEKMPKFNNKDKCLKEIIYLYFSQPLKFKNLNSKTESCNQKPKRSLGQICFSVNFKASWDCSENFVLITW